MSLEILIVLGMAFNVAVFMLSKGFRAHTVGIDSMPAVPIIAGFAYGSSAGLAAGLIVSTAYYVVRLGRVHYAPLTIILNVIVGVLAPYVSLAGLLGAGIIMLVLYHILSFIIVSAIGGLRTGYFMFVIFNFITTLTLLFAASSFG